MPSTIFLKNAEHKQTKKYLHLKNSVMEELLKKFENKLRFASVYLNFEDKEAFTKIIKSLEKDLSPEMKKLQKNLLQDE